jgi:hypothetical protein
MKYASSLSVVGVSQYAFSFCDDDSLRFACLFFPSAFSKLGVAVCEDLILLSVCGEGLLRMGKCQN